MKSTLTAKQKQRLHILESQLNLAISERDYTTAKKLVLEIQAELQSSKHYIRVIKARNKLYELAIELNDFEFAINGLISNRQVLSDKTRIYLETTTLLAICFIRMQEIEKAKVFIREVLINDTVIKPGGNRVLFRKETISRFNEEVALSTLKSSNLPVYNEAEIEKEVIRIIQNLSEQEILQEIGKSAPRATRELLSMVYDYSTKQLPYNERLALPSPEQNLKDAEVGLTIFQSIKKVIYNSLCNPESEIYNVWFKNGMQMILSKGYIKTAVLSCLVSLGIGIKLIAASVIALITKLGIEVYCEKHKPV